MMTPLRANWVSLAVLITHFSFLYDARNTSLCMSISSLKVQCCQRSFLALPLPFAVPIWRRFISSQQGILWLSYRIFHR